MTEQEIKDKIEEVKSELTALQAQLEGKKLRLEVDYDGDLSIWYGKKRVGHIDTYGKCFILSSGTMQERIGQWMMDGMPVDHSTVEWRGGEYELDGFCMLLRTDIHDGCIYSFETFRPAIGCDDTNIQRYPNGTPKLF